MIRNISIGIDLGTTMTRVVVGEFQKGEKIPKIIGTGEAKSEGMRHGYVSNFALAVKSLKSAVSSAERSSGIRIRRAFISLGSITVKGDVSTGMAIVSKADGEVTNLDIAKALEEAEENLSLNNKKVIQVFPMSFRLDGKEVLGRPEGMRGTKLEAKGLFITAGSQHLEDLISVVTACGIEPVDVIPTAVAAGSVALSDKQKIVGGALVDIGSETVSLAVFENSTLISIATFPIGSADITNDIALGLKITLEEAEAMKLGNIPPNFSRKKLDEIIEARLSDVFELVENHLKKIKRSELLPAGVVFVGGGANLPGIEELSKEELKLPSKIGSTEIFGNSKTKLRDPSWFTAVGLIIAGPESGENFSNGSSSMFKDFKNAIKSMTKQLLP